MLATEKDSRCCCCYCCGGGCGGGVLHVVPRYEGLPVGNADPKIFPDPLPGGQGQPPSKDYPDQHQGTFAVEDTLSVPANIAPGEYVLVSQDVDPTSLCRRPSWHPWTLTVFTGPFEDNL